MQGERILDAVGRWGSRGEEGVKVGGHIVAIAICATNCGAGNWVTMAALGQAKEGWFRTFLALGHGIPSHDTFRRVFALVKARFYEGFMSWMQAMVPVRTIAIVRSERVVGQEKSVKGGIKTGRLRSG